MTTSSPATAADQPSASRSPLDRPDFEDRLDRSRLARLRAALAEAGCDGGLFYDPINIRYATGTSNMQVYGLHNPCRYVHVATDGPVTLFDFRSCEHLSTGRVAVDEVRTAVSWYDFVTGPRTGEFVRRWADELASLIGPGRPILAVDRLDPAGTAALTARGVRLIDGQAVANRARRIKTGPELEVIRAAVAAAEWSVAQMRRALVPGRTEQEVWSELHRANIASGGEWLETRLLTSGPRTNPWYQECSAKVIEAGELVAFDTDLVGLGGYSVDISRTWLAGDGPPSGQQRRLHEAAVEQLTVNRSRLLPGASLAEISARAHRPPDGIHSRANAAVAHGIGLVNEYPLILGPDLTAEGYDGELEAGMVLCVEALAAPPGGREAVKLEEQVLIGPTGPLPLSTYPLEL